VAYEVRFADDVKWHLLALTVPERAAALDAIEWQLLHEPLVETRNRKPLRPNPIAPLKISLPGLQTKMKLPYQRVIAAVATALISLLLYLKDYATGGQDFNGDGPEVHLPRVAMLILPVVLTAPAVLLKPWKYAAGLMLLVLSVISFGIYYLPAAVLMLWPERDEPRKLAVDWTPHQHQCSRCGGMYRCPSPEYCPDPGGQESVCRSCL